MSFSKRPVSVTCYICGRGYGTASLAIHVPQCQAKFVAEQEKLPKHLRRPLPEAPTVLGGGGSSAADADKWNEAAFKSYTEHGLVGCEHCGRKFASDRLAIHHRSCTADNPARRVGEKLPGGGGGPVVQRGADEGEDGEGAAFAATAPLPAMPRPSTSGGGRPGTSGATRAAAGGGGGLSATLAALPATARSGATHEGALAGGGLPTRPPPSASPPPSQSIRVLHAAASPPGDAAEAAARGSASPGPPALSITQSLLPRPSKAPGQAAAAAAAAIAATGLSARVATPERAPSRAGSGASAQSQPATAARAHAAAQQQPPGGVGDGSLIEALLDLQADVNDLRLEVHARLEGISDRLARLIAGHDGGVSIGGHAAAASIAPGATTD